MTNALNTHPLRVLRRAIPAGVAALITLTACSGEDTPVQGCPIRVAGAPGITHQGIPITQDTTWRAEDGPHHIVGTLAVNNGATLTVEACAEVVMEADAQLHIGDPGHGEDGHLIVAGEADRKVSFKAGQGPWAALVVFAPGDAELSHVDFEGGGVPTDFGAASIIVLGEGTLPLSRPLKVDTVSIKDSATHGLWMANSARFDPDSKDLVITNAGQAADHFPLLVTGHAAHGLPKGRYTGNANDEILLVEDNTDGRNGLQADVTLRDLGVPYRVGRLADEGLRVGANGGLPATLTIEAGVELRFSPGTSLRTVSDADGPRGRLEIQGTPTEPVVLTSASSTRSRGDWVGLYFESPMADHQVTNALVEYAGGWCSCSLASCSPLDTYDAAVILDGEPQGIFITNSTVRESAGHGFLRSWNDHADLDFLANNTVEGVTGCAQTQPVRSTEVCPDPAYACNQN